MRVQVTDVKAVSLLCPWSDPFVFEVTFHVQSQPQAEEELEWWLVYVGCEQSVQHDQVLECITVEPLSPGWNKFIFEAPAPDPTLIPASAAVGLAAVCLFASFRQQQFMHVGFLVDNQYTDAQFRDNPPAQPDFTKMQREILPNTRRVHLWDISWPVHTPSSNSYPLAIPSSNSNTTTHNVIANTPSNSNTGSDLLFSFSCAPFSPTAPAPEHKADFTEVLPEPLCICILQHLHPEMLRACMRVCKKWNKIISQGVQWTHVDLSVYRSLDNWDAPICTPTYVHNFLRFAMAHTSTNAHTLTLQYVPIQPERLVEWLQKCGSLVALDLRFSPFVRTSHLRPVLQHLQKLSEFHFSLAPSVIRRDSTRFYVLGVHTAPTLLYNHNWTVFVEISQKFQNTLHSVTFPVLTDGSLTQLKSTFSDDFLAEFVSGFPQLQYLGLEMCSSVSQSMVNAMAQRVPTVKASHRPIDFSVDILDSEETHCSVVFVSVLGWPEIVVEEQTLAVLEQLLPNTRRTSKPGIFTYYGNSEAAEEEYLNAGFNDVHTPHTIEDIMDLLRVQAEEEDVECAVCHGPDNEAEMLLCDKCEKGFHLGCLTPQLPEVPAGEWLCARCKNELAAQGPLLFYLGCNFDLHNAYL